MGIRRWFSRMAEKVKAKAKQYGKKSSRVGDLSSEFAGLLVSESPEQPASTNVPPLRPISGNRGKDRGRSPRRTRRTGPAQRLTSAPAPAVSEAQKDYCRPLLAACNIDEIESFDQWERVFEPLLTITKIGDGSYADVFKFATRDKTSKDYVIAKLIAIKPESKAERKGLQWSDMSTIEDAVTEIRLLEMVTEVPGFVEFRGAKVLFGPPPGIISRPTLIFNLHRNEDLAKNVDAVDQPQAGRTTYPDDQIFLLIEMTDAGSDLDNVLEFPKAYGPLPLKDKKQGKAYLDIRQTRDLFWDTASTLANGEQHAKFEHRDLHLSNICVKRNPEAPEDLTYAFVPRSSQLEVVLIDYTLSRAGDVDSVIYNPMADKEIFTSKGDLQFETYRHMRKAVKVGKQERWEEFVPLTNVLWLHHLLVKLMAKTRESDNEEAENLWEAMKRLCDATSPKKMPRKWDYLSAGDLVAMGKEGKRVFVDGVLDAVEVEKAEEAAEKDGQVMQKAKKERYKRLKRESVLSPENIPLPDEEGHEEQENDDTD